MHEDEVKAFIQDRLSQNQKGRSVNLVLDPQTNLLADDSSRRITGSKMDFLLENLEKWQQRLANYVEDEEDDLNPDEWQDLEGSFKKFHSDVLKKFGEDAGDGLHSTPSELYASNAIKAIQLLKTIKWEVSDAFDEIYFDDSEAEVKRILNNVVDKVVLSVEGGRSFERTDIHWVDPSLDQEFNKELYDFASADQVLPDAENIPWLPPALLHTAKLLPRDLIKRLTTPLKISDVDDHEDWEFSATHLPHEEESYKQFEGPHEQLRKNLKDILTTEIHNYSNKVDTTASIDPAVVEVAAKRLEAGEIDVDFKSMFILPYEANHCKLVGVRDDNMGNTIAYKEVLKPPSERIADQKLRNDPSAWFDPERPAGPRVRTFGWEPLADLEEDIPPDETEMIKKKENPDALAAGSEMNAVTRERAEKLVQTLKGKCSKTIKEKSFILDSTANPLIKDYLKRKGQRFGIIPESFESPEDFLDTLDIPKLREKDAGKAFPMDNEVIPLQSDWLGLDGTGPHEQLTEELYWKQLQTLKKPLSVPSVDWKALLEVPDEDDDGADSALLRRYLMEATKPHLNKEEEKEVAPPKPQDSSKVEKDTPARKRALDKEFLKDWVNKFGDEEGIQGLDPKNFKPPEHLVSSEEYGEKFLTHPYTSSYVFHPNFVRFRRMTRNNPTYAEYTFKKLESASALNLEDNLMEFKSILSDLDTNGPKIYSNDIQQLNEQNLGVEPEEAKKWDLEFSTFMNEGLSKLESFAASSRNASTRPDKQCLEETSKDLLFSEVEKHELPEFHKEFCLQPFTLEDFGNIPDVGSGIENSKNDNKLKESKSSSQTEVSDSESEESEEKGQVIHEDVVWRPFTQFNGYKHTNVLQLLSDASLLIDTTAPKHPPPKVLDWIQGKYQPSTRRLKKWRKLYGSLFPKVNSSLKTPYLFLSEEERLNMLQKPDTGELQDPDNPWTLTEEEKIALKNSAKKADDTEETQEDPGDEKVARLEELSGISVRLHRSSHEWAEELETSEAPDMSVLGTPAMEFMFTLDNFQKQAIMALEKGYNVFVSAHTSAGKTVVAEYAIAMSRKRRSRAIYTSPIKALSNQKYKDFKKCFESVGLITGDVQLNETADCLIMTTEILRSMLYNASEGIRDLEFVVLDEVHYMNDRERGHVWEEVLILLPANVQIVMLSATVPNTMEFANWVGRNKERKVMVCRTLHRPVPLKHYFYVDVPKNPDQGQFLLRNGDGPVLKHEWQQIRRFIEELEMIMKEERKAVLRKLDEKRALEGKKIKMPYHPDFEDQTKTFGGGPNKQEIMKFYNKKEKVQWSKFIKYLKDIEWLPTIVFAFSRKKCDDLAELLSDIDLTTPIEKLCIKAFIKSQVSQLDEEDRNLPQIRTLESHLIRGIGVHHSGILPVLKEIVEFLFQEGKVKLLFATETFAMGVNMPARTVVFYSIKKFDGGEQRFLLPAEYIQMAGRAGRRGEDTVGNVIIRCPSRDAKELSIETIEAMMTGSPQTLTSQFRVSYRMILGTLTARSHITAENMMKQSYHENNEQTKYFQLEDALRIAKDLENKQRTVIHSRYNKDYVDRCCQIYNNIDECLKMWSKLREAESETPKFVKEVQVGKLVKFRCGPVASAIGVIMKITAKPLEFLVMGLRNFDNNAVLEPHPEMHESTRWFKFLSMCPLPNQKYSGGELDMRLVFYKMKVDDILEIYKDSVNVSNENSAFLIRNAQNANIGGRSRVSSEIGTIFPHPNGYSQASCMLLSFPQNSPPDVMNPSSQFINLANSSFSNLSKLTSPQSFNPISPGNVFPYQVLQGSRVGSSNNGVGLNSCNSREQFDTHNPLSLGFTSVETLNPLEDPNVPNPRFDIPSSGSNERSILVNSINPVHEHVQIGNVSQQFSHPLIGQPLVYFAPVCSRLRPSLPPTQMDRPEFNVPNMWLNASPLNSPSWCRPPQAVPPIGGHPANHRNLILTPLKLNNLASPANNISHTVRPPRPHSYDLVSPTRSWPPNVQQIQHHGFTKPNAHQDTKVPVHINVKKPPVLKNETEFPKLGSGNAPTLKDKLRILEPQKLFTSDTSKSSPSGLNTNLRGGHENSTISTSDESIGMRSSKKLVKMSISRANKLRKSEQQDSCTGESVEELRNLETNCGTVSQSVDEHHQHVEDLGPYSHRLPQPVESPSLTTLPLLVPSHSSNPSLKTSQSSDLMRNPLEAQNPEPTLHKNPEPKISISRRNKSRKSKQQDSCMDDSIGELRNLQHNIGTVPQSVDYPIHIKESDLHSQRLSQDIESPCLTSLPLQVSFQSTDHIQNPHQTQNSVPNHLNLFQMKGSPFSPSTTHPSLQQASFNSCNPNSTILQSTYSRRHNQILAQNPIQAQNPDPHCPYISQMNESPHSQSPTSPPRAPPGYFNPNLIAYQSVAPKLRIPIQIHNPDLNRRYPSQVSGSPSNSRPPPTFLPYNPIFTPHPNLLPPVFNHRDHWLHSRNPPNCYPALGYSQNKTKCDAELEHICYKLHSPTGLKPVDEVSLARESDFELYQFMKIKEEEVVNSIAEFYSGQSREDFIEAFAKVFKWMETLKGKNQLQKEVADKTMTLYPEYANKMEILKTMNYVVEDSVQMKGYMAARVSKYELVITEILVRNVIKDLTPEEVAGLMSFIVYQARTPSAQNNDSTEEIPIANGLPNLQQAIENTKTIIFEIREEERDRCVVSEDMEDLKEDSFKLTDIMYLWAKQKSFGKIITMAKNFQEGMLVRWIQQLVEALKEIESAARVMGDPAVPEKIQAAIKSIKRGIVFSPSLYTTL